MRTRVLARTSPISSPTASAPLGTDMAQALQGGHVSISGDDANLFVYADTSTQAETAHAVILAELEHHAIVATTSGVEHWLADEERWDNEPAGETWEEEVTEKGYAPWEVRVDLPIASRGGRARGTLETEGYQPDPPVVAPDRRRRHPRGRRRARSTAARRGRAGWRGRVGGSDRLRRRAPVRLLRLRRAPPRRPWRTISTHSSSTSSRPSSRSSPRPRPARPSLQPRHSGRRRSRVATATTRRGGCRRRAAASTRSARRATRAMPPSRWPSARRIPRCSITARVPSTSPEPLRLAATACRTSCSGSPLRSTSRSRAGATRSSAITTLP